MTKARVFLIHGWGGSPLGDWFPWAAAELIKLDYEVVAPSMPNTDEPTIDVWVSYLAQQVGEIRPSDIFVGHSIGCQTILRYLEKVRGVAAKVFLVAPWFTLSNLENEQMWKIADPWLNNDMNFDSIKQKSKEFITIFSDNDPWVPYHENRQLFEQKLNPAVVVLHDKGHITADEGSRSLPELIALLQPGKSKN